MGANARSGINRFARQVDSRGPSSGSVAATTEEVRFPAATGSGDVLGIVHRPATGEPRGGLVVAHGRSGSLKAPLIRRLCEAAAEAGLLALRFNFRYMELRGQASRDLSTEEDDLLGAVRFVRQALPSRPILVAGASMGARVCARASADSDVAGMIALGYPLHPKFRPEVRNPPEWPKVVKPALFVQGDHDPFCDLARLNEELPRLTEPHDLVVIPNAGHSFEPKGGKRDTFPEVREAVLRWIETRLASARPDEG